MITDSIKTYIIIILGACLVVTGLYHFTKVTYYKSKIAGLEADVITVKGELQQCNYDLSLAEQINHRQASLIESQNLSIRGWKDAAEQRQVEVDRAREAIRGLNAVRQKQTEALLPLTPSGEQCPSLAKQLDAYIGFRQSKEGK